MLITLGNSLNLAEPQHLPLQNGKTISHIQGYLEEYVCANSHHKSNTNANIIIATWKEIILPGPQPRQSHILLYHLKIIIKSFKKFYQFSTDCCKCIILMFLIFLLHIEITLIFNNTKTI